MTNQPITIERDVFTLATSAGRVAGSRSHERAMRYLAARMTECGLIPYSGTSLELPYEAVLDGETIRLTNLVGVLPGSNPLLAPVLLGAHYDTCGVQPGADDNAAAVAALLAVIPKLREMLLHRSVVVAFFDGEEPPHYLTERMGSRRFYADQRTGSVAAALVLDLVGHDVPIPGLEDLLFVLGAESNRDIAGAVRSAQPQGIRVLPVQHDVAPDLSDHEVFRKDGCPFLFLSCGRGPDYHQVTDTAEKVAYAKTAAVGRYIGELVRALDGTELARGQEGDTTELELRAWPRCWTPKQEPLRSIRAPRSRLEIDQLTDQLGRLL